LGDDPPPVVPDAPAGPVGEGELGPDGEGEAPQPAGSPAPTTQITSGGYQRHYTHTAESAGAEAFLDVTVDSSLTSVSDPANPGAPPTTVETGTITYTA
jgi:hypothetical protein